ncbi:chorismate mutase family protein [Variovorax sp. WS11]|uniref:chorismate mutase family protein n=1 Tax=Variovorax sp. WS11 TaxID=1105204 RepID=UPI001C626926|nr:chorismate mutase family protein [Variovorax sp. WS11]
MATEAKMILENSGDAEIALQALREELDQIDMRLLRVVRDRLECCGRIGHHKRQHGVPMMQPARIGVVQQRAATFAQAHGVNADFLRSLYELIIAETCRLEDEIIGADGAARVDARSG